MDWINEHWMFSPSKLKKGIPHKDFTFPLWSFHLHYLPLASLPCCRTCYLATSPLHQSTRQISINNICKNSLAKKKKSLTGCHELLGKAFMARVGMITLVPEMRQNTSIDVKEGTPYTTSQGYNWLLQNLQLIRQFPWSAFKFYICVNPGKNDVV